MSQPSAAQPSRRARWIVVILLFIAVSVVILWIVFIQGSIPKNRFGVAGGLKLEGPAGMRLYVGDKLVGTGTIELSWDELWGGDQPGLAMMLEPGAGPVTPEMLAGPGAVQLQVQPSGATSGANQHVALDAAKETRLLRRADGTLDLVFVLAGKVTTSHHNPQRFRIVIRPRTGPLGKSGYVDSGGHGGSSRGAFMWIIPGATNQWWGFQPGEPPKEFAEEIKQKGLWEPQNSR